MTGLVADTDAAVSAVVEDGVLTLTLNRPDKGNALRQADTGAVIEYIAAIDSAGPVRAIRIRSEGRNFCAGADLVSANAGTERPKVGHLTRSLESGPHAMIAAVWNAPVPTIAEVQGRALGLGLHLAVACDFTLAGDDAVFTEPFSKRGFSVDSGGSYLLPRLIGLRRTRQMLLRGISVPADTALDWGLVDAVVPAATLSEQGAALAAELALGPTYSLGHTKRLLNDPPPGGLGATLGQEAASVETTLRSADFKEGLRAFVERRDPRFTGE